MCEANDYFFYLDLNQYYTSASIVGLYLILEYRYGLSAWDILLVIQRGYLHVY